MLKNVVVHSVPVMKTTCAVCRSVIIIHDNAIPNLLSFDDFMAFCLVLQVCTLQNKSNIDQQVDQVISLIMEGFSMVYPIGKNFPLIKNQMINGRFLSTIIVEEVIIVS